MLPLIIVGIATLAVIVLAFLEWDRIKTFIGGLKNRLRGIKTLSKNDKVFTLLKQDLDSGNFETVYGMFDDDGIAEVDGEIGAERVQSQEVDEKLLQAHRNSALVIHG
jgi:hypothetical protein